MRRPDDGYADPWRPVRCVPSGFHELGEPSFLNRVLRDFREDLAPMQIGKAGQLQEWLEDWDEQAPKSITAMCRISTACFQDHKIDPRRMPELTAAAKKSLQIERERERDGALPGRSTCGPGCSTATMPSSSSKWH